MSKKKQRFKEFVADEVNVQYIASLVSKGSSITQAVKSLCEFQGVEYEDSLRRLFSIKLEKQGVTDNVKEKAVPIEQTEEYKEALKRKVKKSKYYLITYAQAETPIHRGFWENMKAYATHIGAEIIVSAGRYGNPNSLKTSKDVERKEKNKYMWEEDLIGDLYSSRVQLGDNLEVLCDVKVMPTAVLPISTLNGFTGMKSSILPHPKVQLQSLPILDGYPHKLIMSTGAVTVPNYTDTKAGHKGKFHHQLGFVIAEIEDDGVFHLRQVQADEMGRFYDLWFVTHRGEVTDTRKTKEDFSYDMVFGDLHVANHNPESVDLAVEIANELKVENIVLHDILDGESINHHEEKDPFRLLEKEEAGKDDLKAEINDTIQFTLNLTKRVDYAKLHIVASNHSDFLDRHLRNVDWRKSPNKLMYLKLSNIVADGLAPKGVFNYLLEDAYSEVYYDDSDYYLETYGYGDSLRLKGWELGLHGDLGVNGSRASIKQFKNLSTKTISGHTHAPAREDGSIICGTLTKLRLGYNKGLSSWMSGVVVIYPNSKASNIHFIKGRYTTLK